MSKFAVRVDDFEDAALPRVCAATGESADHLYGYTARYRPSWPIVFIVLGPVGWLIMVVAAWGTGRSVSGYLPFSEAAQADMRANRRAAWRNASVCAVVSVALVTIALVGDAGVVAAILVAVGLSVTTWFIATASSPWGSVSLKLARDGRSIVLADTSPRFDAAYRRQEEKRLESRQRGATEFVLENARGRPAPE